MTAALLQRPSSGAAALRRVACCLAVAMIPAVPELSAQAPPPPKVFYACYVPAVGAVYRIKESGILQKCATGHVQFSWTDGVASGGGVTAHSALTGLTNDDHPGYLLTDGTRALTGDLSVGGKKLTNLAAASANGEAVRFEDAVKTGDAAAGDLAGTFPSPTVARLRGTAVDPTAPTNGQVLTFNGTTWAPATPTSGGVSDHGALTGLTDDDHSQYLLVNGVRNATNGFAVTGTFGTGVIPSSGAGVRVMWYPGKVAFRAGRVQGAQWDDANVGEHSMAIGLNTTASGVLSTAMGFGSTASGDVSTAMGEAAIASGLRTTAIGWGSTSSGDASTAIGVNAVASGNRSTALGNNITASGNVSTAMGAWASTNGHDGAFVHGDFSTVSVLNAQAPNEFAVRAAGGFRFRTASDLSTGCDLPAGSGVFTCTSSRLSKHHFAPLDGETVLGELARLQIQSWSYKTEAGGIRHVGPVAEEFYDAFRLGTGPTTIGSIDADGINLLAIQALEARTTALQRENATLRAALERLEAQVLSLGRR